MNYYVGRMVKSLDDKLVFVADAVFYFYSDARAYLEKVNQDFPNSGTIMFERKIKMGGLVINDLSIFKENQE